MRTCRRLAVGALVAALPSVLLGCGFGSDQPAERPEQASAEEASAKARERVQAYLDAVTAKDVAAGRSQLCAAMHKTFDGAATGPNGDFADHFEVPEAKITDVRPGSRGLEVSTSMSVTTGTRKITRPLVFTVTRDGADWCIAGELPGGNTPGPATTP
ncbi:nuclear transport factor 2 family protein [Micromonospora sp. WMMA1363]|uniref:nuclear transport factor 2 family protein n=1 Tax=Micromonospora sp. WMMA1363 TaxID=3053985 RepID=UPI00259CEDA9|nr:nuclear transport factor 2 family protein [Micromonospora sp. WMMA1363]MDM4720015.1 nuclear transport factor 2 family protein [Micromonospora sp. WMMA1363]